MNLEHGELIKIPIILEVVHFGREHANETIRSGARSLTNHWKGTSGSSNTVSTNVAIPTNTVNLGAHAAASDKKFGRSGR